MTHTLSTSDTGPAEMLHDAHAAAQQEELRRVAIVDMARDQHGSEGRVEIDDNTILSEGDDNGTYVQAWVWVDLTDSSFDKAFDDA